MQETRPDPHIIHNLREILEKSDSFMLMLKITFLGTNGWYDTVTGNTISILIETGSHFIILDAGNGLHKVDQYIQTEKPVYLFLSHFHMDHIEGLHILNKLKFPQGLTIVGQTGTSDILNCDSDSNFFLL